MGPDDITHVLIHGSVCGRTPDIFIPAEDREEFIKFPCRLFESLPLSVISRHPATGIFHLSLSRLLFFSPLPGQSTAGTKQTSVRFQWLYSGIYCSYRLTAYTYQPVVSVVIKTRAKSSLLLPIMLTLIYLFLIISKLNNT